MVSQRNKAHKNRFRSKGKLKNQSKGKKVQNRFRVVGNANETEKRHNTADKSPVSLRQSRSTRTFSSKQIEGFVKISMASDPSTAEKQSRLADRTQAMRSRQPNSYRVAALIPLNRQSCGAGVLRSFTKNNFQVCEESNTLPEKQSIMHDGCLVTFLDPFAQLWDESSAALDTDRVDFAAVMDSLLVADMIIFVVSLDGDAVECERDVWYGDLGIHIDALGRHMISLVNAIGAPGIFVNFHRSKQENEDRTHDRKLQALVKLHKRYLCSVLPSKQVSLSSTYQTSTTKAAMTKFWRALNESKLDVVKWRTHRPYMLVEQHMLLPHEGSTDKGRLVVSGYLRGAPMSVKQLVTISGMDTQSFAIDSIDRLDETLTANDSLPSISDARESGLILPYSSINTSGMHDQFSSGDDVLTDDSEGKESPAQGFLNDENQWHHGHPHGDMAIDEPFSSPTQLPGSREDHTTISKRFKQPYRTLKVPEGVSGYQAAWYDYDENVIDVEESPTSSMKTDARQPTEGSYLSTRNLNRLETTDQLTDDEMSLDGHSGSENGQLPSVRQRFYKYRPLPTAMMPSAMSSTNAMAASSVSAVFTNRFSAKSAAQYWDPYQNLPDSYAKLFSLPLIHFRRTCKEGMSPIVSDGQDQSASLALPGQRITVHIENFPLNEAPQLVGKAPLILSGLLPQEEKLSLLHVALTGLQNTLCGEPTVGSEESMPTLESKHSMVFQVGFRRYRARGMFYTDLPGGNQGELRLATFNEQMPTGKKVMETILQRRATYCKEYCPSGPAGASYCVAHYGLMTHIPVPVFILQNRSLLSSADAAVGLTQHLICTTGRALAPDPHLLILKKRRLIGKIYKVHQGSAVIKKMFMDDQDVKYFEKIELRTLRGVKGRIMKSIGTHGTFKAKFNAVVQQHDKVYIDLFKRVFPPSYEASADENCVE